VPCTVVEDGVHHAADREKVLRSTMHPHMSSMRPVLSDTRPSSFGATEVEWECVDSTPWWLHYWFGSGMLSMSVTLFLVMCFSRRARLATHGIGNFDNKFMNRLKRHVASNTMLNKTVYPYPH